MNNEYIGKKTRREYMRQYRKNNKKKIEEINERYWINKAIKDSMSFN